ALNRADLARDLARHLARGVTPENLGTGLPLTRRRWTRTVAARRVQVVTSRDPASPCAHVPPLSGSSRPIRGVRSTCQLIISWRSAVAFAAARIVRPVPPCGCMIRVLRDQLGSL